jgi:hypothetical protein
MSVPKAVRRIVMLAVGLTISAAILIGGPLSSGGLFLTLPTTGDREPVRLPWLEPYHKGGIDFATGIYVRNDQDLIVRGGDLPVVLQRTYNSKDPESGAFVVLFKVGPIIEHLARDKKLDLILSADTEMLLWADRSVDITSEVVKQLTLVS